MARVMLTDRSVAALQPKEKRYDVSDSKRVGLRVRVAPTGIKTWVFEKRVRGESKLRSHTLGRFPVISLAEAREKALTLEKEAVEGVDRKAEVKNMQTVRTILDRYDEMHLAQLRTGKQRRKQIEVAFGNRLDDPMNKVERRHLQEFIDKVAGKGTKVLANRYKAAISAFTSFAWKRGYIDQNIGAGLAKAPGKEKPRDRLLTLTEVRAIYDAAGLLSPLWTPIIRLLILTAQRRGDIVGLRHSEIDFDKRRIDLPGSRTKNGKAHIVHLSEPALEIASAVTPTNDLMFTTTGKTPVSGFSKVKVEIDKLLPEDMAPWTFHDFRTAFATIMAEGGADEGIVDRILNHSASASAASAVARVYNLSAQLDKRAIVLDRWAELVTKRSAKVVSIAS
ncbi:tyrosine-type recombinase/integrase [Fertoebacter nigrum]|jgi:integrase|uniref:Tyrosine-type recombinase/integrase n=1 Tax=Fertoeibacter niger TaxID=2656921 RepID=A0A8X8H1I7_9RHOB|nr:tyrosine-type recombinase/integrase [Fertoeibacter niger]NUB43853.1 tyrosine-type recombinase/integrase [Fertoeibacter niger]